jgi:anhydro-N-acetylmuramic acid kinase
VAFDTGPGVVVIDGVVERLTNGAERMDRDAKFSRGGEAIGDVVEEMLEMPYFSAPPPKSTGRELFNAAFISEFIGRCRAAAPHASNADIVATAVSLTCRSVALGYRRFVPGSVREMLLSGGGAKHPLLRETLASELAPMQVRDFAEVYFDAEAKEAVAFALLGFLYLIGRHSNVPGATGASGPRVLGKLTPA